MKLYLLRYGEIGTKSTVIRRNFELVLMDNIERMFLKEGKEVILERTRGRIFAHADDTAENIFARIFGIVSYSPVTKVSSEIDDILEISGKIWVGKRGTFAVRARRSGTHPYTSQELAAAVGGAVLETNPGLKVNLDSPERELHVEVRDGRAYIFTEIRPGPGGLPLGSQGKVAAYVESRNDFLAVWLMMKRGARAYIIHPSASPWADMLERWDPNLRRLEVENIHGLSELKLPSQVQGMVMGETMESLCSTEYDLPIFRPLIGFNRGRISEYIEKIASLCDSQFDHL